MKRFEAIERAIDERWPRDPAAEMCRAIINYAISKPDESSVMLTYGDFAKLTGASFDQEELQRAITILVSRFEVLELRLVYFDEVSRAFYLEEEEQRDFIRSGILAHPDSGETVLDAAERVYPYYVAAPKQLLEEVQN